MINKKYILHWIKIGFLMASFNTILFAGACDILFCIPPPYKVDCMKPSCNTAIEGAMKQQKKTLANRLDDLIGVIQANIRQTKNQTVIIEKEILAYRRLRERIKVESTMLKEASHVSRQIKNSTSLGTQINIIQERKE